MDYQPASAKSHPKDPGRTLTIDRLVHHATILEFTGESQRLRTASKPAA